MRRGVATVVAAGAALLAAGLATADGEAWRIVEPADLRAAPDPGSSRIAELAEDTPVERTERRGGWVAVRPPDGESGWVRVWKVREVEQGEGLLGALKRFGRKVTGYFSGDSETGSQGNVTATIGVRGLGGHGGKVDYQGKPLGVATVDTTTLQRVRRYGVGPREARGFAREAGLQPRPQIITPGAGVSEAEDWSGEW